ncbi:unnamed protein product [Rotaria sp. Silwood1]|nr:unnamed protein product [Rotaria sp. Silwood1]
MKVEQLENELKLYKEGRHTNQSNSHDNPDMINLIQEENRRLKAENNVLQKKLSELSTKTVESISTASSSNESFQKEDVEVECDDNRCRQYYRRLIWFQRLPMNQRLCYILLAAVLIFGLIIIYRSYQPADSIASNNTKKNFFSYSKASETTTLSSFFLPYSVISDTPVRVDFFVMSKCPDARKCELLFAPTLLKLSSIINFTVSFIAHEKNLNEITCMHGSNECLGNKQQLCVQSMCSQTTLIKFLQCQSKQMENIPDNGEQCVKELSDNTLKWSDIDTCVKSNKANELFHKSLEKTRSASAKKSCTMHLNGKFWCMHDGTWYGCTEGRDEKSLIKAICSRYNGPNKPIECTMSI